MAAKGLADQGLLAIGHLAACTCPSHGEQAGYRGKGFALDFDLL